jgi:DNA-binding GntR family transcriptional regulator
VVAVAEPIVIKNEGLNLKLYHVLKEMIILNELEPGRRLVIKELCEKFEVSSSPVRDALHYLAANGLVEDRENGYYVICPSESDVEEIYEMRGLLEPFALIQIFPRLKSQYLTDLRDRIMKSSTEQNFQNDMDFHNILSENCQNLRLKKQLQILANQSFLIGYKLHSTTNIHEEIGEHLEILDALISRNLELANSNLKQHLIKSKERIIKYCFK